MLVCSRNVTHPTDDQSYIFKTCIIYAVKSYICPLIHIASYKKHENWFYFMNCCCCMCVCPRLKRATTHPLKLCHHIVHMCVTRTKRCQACSRRSYTKIFHIQKFVCIVKTEHICGIKTWKRVDGYEFD